MGKEYLKPTPEDLWQDFRRYGRYPPKVLGLVETLDNVFWEGISGNLERAKLLLAILARGYPNTIPGVKVYPAAIRGLLKIKLYSNGPSILLCKEDEELLLEQFLCFLGKHGLIEEVRGLVREFLGDTINRWHEAWSLRFRPSALKERGQSLPRILAKPLLIYQPYRTIESMVLYRPVCEFIPVLAAMLRMQVEERLGEGEEAVRHIENVVERGWSGRKVNIVRLLRWVKNDARLLIYLLDLATAYIDKHGAHYPTEELQ